MQNRKARGLEFRAPIVEIAAADPMAAADVVIAAQDDLIVVEIVGRVIDVTSAGGIWQRNENVDELLRRRIEAVSRNDAAWERRLCDRIGGLQLRLGEIANALERGRDDQARYRGGLPLPQAFVSEKEEGAVAPLVDVGNPGGPAEAAAELVALEFGHDQGKEVARVEIIVAHELVSRTMKLVGSGARNGVDHRARSTSVLRAVI